VHEIFFLKSFTFTAFAYLEANSKIFVIILTKINKTTKLYVLTFIAILIYFHIKKTEKYVLF